MANRIILDLEEGEVSALSLPNQSPPSPVEDIIEETQIAKIMHDSLEAHEKQSRVTETTDQISSELPVKDHDKEKELMRREKNERHHRHHHHSRSRESSYRDKERDKEKDRERSRREREKTLSSRDRDRHRHKRDRDKESRSDKYPNKMESSHYNENKEMKNPTKEQNNHEEEIKKEENEDAEIINVDEESLLARLEGRDDEDEEELIGKRRKRMEQLSSTFGNPTTEEKNPPQEAKKNLTSATLSSTTEPSLQYVKKSAEPIFDMFSSSPILATNMNILRASQDVIDNWDDSEGYYTFRPHEIIIKRYEVFANCGKGVFSSVFRVRDSQDNNKEVVLKIIRRNEMMYRAGLREMKALDLLAQRDPEKKRHCIRLLTHFEFRNHLVMVFESMKMNLREVLKKFGGVGLHISAVQSYTKQLLIALRHLSKSGLLHADIKPDNILCNDSMNVVKLCDFGSAVLLTDCEITPYLYSRFYRPPEIIIGLHYDQSADMWALGTTIFELYTGKILFRGIDNNEMLRYMIELKGDFSQKIIKKAQFRSQHFDEMGAFIQFQKDPVTQIEIRRKPLIRSNKDLKSLLNAASTTGLEDERKKVNQLYDLINRMLILDPLKRITVEQALQHPFVRMM